VGGALFGAASSLRRSLPRGPVLGLLRSIDEGSVRHRADVLGALQPTRACSRDAYRLQVCAAAGTAPATFRASDFSIGKAVGETSTNAQAAFGALLYVPSGFVAVGLGMTELADVDDGLERSSYWR
jgi:hypothetical protein